MNIYKKFISTICASVFAFSCFGFNTNAKVIEPEIVKTETWTTSYYIDDDMDTLYPYIQCEADIYNDGTIKLYMWNTHEWDGFATVSHVISLICTSPVTDKDMLYSFKKIGCYDDVTNGRWCYPITEQTYISGKYTIDSSEVDLLDVSYYPSSYHTSGGYIYETCYKQMYYEYTYPDSFDAFRYSRLSYRVQGTNTYLPYLDALNKRPDRYASFKPTSETNLSTVQYFHLFGHDITITPEMLSGNIIAEPELTEQEKYIKQLEEENSKLKTEIESYKKLDFDGDGLLTNADAQMILVYYTNSLVGKTTGKVEDYGEYIKLIGN